MQSLIRVCTSDEVKNLVKEHKMGQNDCSATLLLLLRSIFLKVTYLLNCTFYCFIRVNTSLLRCIKLHNIDLKKVSGVFSYDRVKIKMILIHFIGYSVKIFE